MTIHVSFNKKYQHFRVSQNRNLIKNVPFVYAAAALGVKSPKDGIPKLRKAFTATYEPEAYTLWSVISSPPRKNEGAFSELGAFQPSIPACE